MATVKKANVSGGQPPVKKKVVTDMQRDEMGKRVSPVQKKQQQKAELKMIDYKGRKSMKKTVSNLKKK